MYPPYGRLINTYGSQELTESSPPQSFVEPLTLAEVGAYLRLPPTMLRSPYTDEIQGFISAARSYAEGMQKRDLVRKQWDISFDFWPSYQIEFRSPLVSVDLVQYRDSTGAVTAMAEGTSYVVDRAKSPGVLIPPYNVPWPFFVPWPGSAILIRYTSGFMADDPWWTGDTGTHVKVGMKELVKSWFNKEGLTDAQMQRIDNLLSFGAVRSAR